MPVVSSFRVLLLFLFTASLTANASAQDKRTLLAESATADAYRQPVECPLGRASADLDLAGAHARVYNKGNIAYDGGDHVYSVPKETGLSPLFAASPWVGGFVGGELRIAAATYAQFGQDYEFWPGPLDEQGNPPEDCLPYDRIWSVSALDIAHYEQTGQASADLLEWPWHLGAPVIDGDGVPGNYNLAGGDRPEVLGHQTLWWVMNDAAGVHRSTLSAPLQIEVQVTAFVLRSDTPSLNDATFYRYRILNRGASAIDSMVVTMFADPDLGDLNDDYLGSDVARNLGFVYNSTNIDHGPHGYGENPPAFGVKVFEDLGAFTYYTNEGMIPDTPFLAPQYYNYMTGYWSNGNPFTFGGNGYGGTEPYPFVFPSEPGTYWSEPCPQPDCSTPPSAR